MGYAKYFVFPITSTSLTHCTPGITIVYTTVHAISLPGGWHRNLRRLRLSPGLERALLSRVASLFLRISFPTECTLFPTLGTWNFPVEAEFSITTFVC